MAETAIAYPPRFRWLKRGTIIGISVIFVLAGVRCWWGWEAQRRLDAFVAAAHARGEPILVEDFKAPAFASEDNAAPILLRAAAAVQWPLNVNPDPQTPEGLRAMWEIGQMNMSARTLTRAARDKPYAYWGARVPNPMVGRNYPFSGLRSLANLLATSAQGEEAMGNDHEAIELLRDLLREGRALDDRPEDLITHLVAVAIDSSATDSTLELGQHLRITAANRGVATTAPGTPASADQIRALIADLADERSLRSSAQWYWHGEAAGILTSVPTIAMQTRLLGSNRIPRALYWIGRPMFEIDSLNLIDRYQTFSQTANTENFPSASAIVRTVQLPDRFGRSDFERLTKILSQSMAYSARIVEVNFRSLTEHRAAATLLAISLYRAEHHGAMPRALANLVPDYVPAVPVDPMRADGGPFGYLPEAHPPILYSVGLNGKDDGGSTRPLQSSYERWRNLDAVFALADPATTKPSGETEDHQ